MALPLKFWKHYFNALIPPLCLFAGLFVLLMIERGHRAWGWRPGVVAGVILVPICLLMIKHTDDSRSFDRVNVPRTIAEHIRRGGSNGHDVYVFNYDPLVYAYADEVPPTRFVLSIELSEFHGSSGARSVGEISRILAASPRWIVVADPSPYAFTPQIWQDLDTALKGYRLVAGTRSRTTSSRRSPSVCSGPGFAGRRKPTPRWLTPVSDAGRPTMAGVWTTRCWLVVGRHRETG